MGFNLQREAHNKAVSINPNYVGILQHGCKLEEAIHALNKALFIKPDYADAYINLGNTLKDQGTLEKAIEAYNKVLSNQARLSGYL